jgi:hypothetical protein
MTGFVLSGDKGVPHWGQITTVILSSGSLALPEADVGGLLVRHAGRVVSRPSDRLCARSRLQALSSGIRQLSGACAVPRWRARCQWHRVIVSSVPVADFRHRQLSGSTNATHTRGERKRAHRGGVAHCCESQSVNSVQARRNSSGICSFDSRTY